MSQEPQDLQGLARIVDCPGLPTSKLDRRVKLLGEAMFWLLNLKEKDLLDPDPHRQGHLPALARHEAVQLNIP